MTWYGKSWFSTSQVIFSLQGLSSHSWTQAPSFLWLHLLFLLVVREQAHKWKVCRSHAWTHTPIYPHSIDGSHVVHLAARKPGKFVQLIAVSASSSVSHVSRWSQTSSPVGSQFYQFWGPDILSPISRAAYHAGLLRRLDVTETWKPKTGSPCPSAPCGPVTWFYKMNCPLHVLWVSVWCAQLTLPSLIIQTRPREAGTR